MTEFTGLLRVAYLNGLADGRYDGRPFPDAWPNDDARAAYSTGYDEGVKERAANPHRFQVKQP